jgi:ABC-type transporter Mla subunit MlaD
MSVFRRLRGDTIPLGRLTIALQVIIAVIAGGYLLTRFHGALPLVAPQYKVDVILVDAAGLDASHRPRVLIAGVPSGFVTGVRYSPTRGKAIATLSLDKDTRGKLHSDATVRIYPRSALQDLVLDIAPGRSSAPVLGPGGTLDAAGATVPVGYDQMTSVLNGDTRAYTQILIDTLAQTLNHRPGRLRAAIRRLPDLTTSTTTVVRELATRRRLLVRFVAQLDRITNATGRRGAQLVAAIQAARMTLGTTAARTSEIAQSMRLFPPTLAQATNTFGAVQQLAAPLVPALDSLLPAAHALPQALRSTRSLIPPAHGLLDDLRPLVTNEFAPLKSLRDVADRLGPVARGLLPTIPTLQKYVDTIDANKRYVSDLVNNWPGGISINSTTGAETRALFVGNDGPYPQLFGLPASSTRTADGKSRFIDQLRKVLGITCLKLNRAACYALPSLLAKTRASR